MTDHVKTLADSLFERAGAILCGAIGKAQRGEPWTVHHPSGAVALIKDGVRAVVAEMIDKAQCDMIDYASALMASHVESIHHGAPDGESRVAGNGGLPPARDTSADEPGRGVTEPKGPGPVATSEATLGRCTFCSAAEPEPSKPGDPKCWDDVTFPCKHCGKPVKITTPYHSDAHGFWHWECPVSPPSTAADVPPSVTIYRYDDGFGSPRLIVGEDVSEPASHQTSLGVFVPAERLKEALEEVADLKSKDREYFKSECASLFRRLEGMTKGLGETIRERDAARAEVERLKKELRDECDVKVEAISQLNVCGDRLRVIGETLDTQGSEKIVDAARRVVRDLEMAEKLLKGAVALLAIHFPVALVTTDAVAWLEGRKK